MWWAEGGRTLRPNLWWSFYERTYISERDLYNFLKQKMCPGKRGKVKILKMHFLLNWATIERALALIFSSASTSNSPEWQGFKSLKNKYQSTFFKFSTKEVEAKMCHRFAFKYLQHAHCAWCIVISYTTEFSNTATGRENRGDIEPKNHGRKMNAC